MGWSGHSWSARRGLESVAPFLHPCVSSPSSVLSSLPPQHVHLLSPVPFLLPPLPFLSISCQVPGIHWAPPLAWPLHLLLRRPVRAKVQLWEKREKEWGCSITICRDPGLDPRPCPMGPRSWLQTLQDPFFWTPSLASLSYPSWPGTPYLLQVQTWLHPPSSSHCLCSQPPPALIIQTQRNQTSVSVLLDPEGQVRAPPSGQERWHPWHPPQRSVKDDAK